MPEGQVVGKTKTLCTVESLRDDFKALGIEKGMVLLVHSSLSAMGWVCGGAVAVIIALQEVLGETGTLVMPGPFNRPQRSEPVGESRLSPNRGGKLYAKQCLLTIPI